MALIDLKNAPIITKARTCLSTFSYISREIFLSSSENVNVNGVVLTFNLLGDIEGYSNTQNWMNDTWHLVMFNRNIYIPFEDKIIAWNVLIRPLAYFGQKKIA